MSEDSIKWKPIETAPVEDGFTALVSGLLYNKGPGRWVSTAEWFDGAWWESEESRTEGNEPLYDPTHWMPLPDPPDQPQ